MNTEFPGKILVATDFSDASYTAFPYALEHAKNNPSTLTLVNAVGLPPVVVSYEHLPTTEEINALKKEAKLKIETKLKKIARDYFSGVATEEVVLEGIGWSADTIVDYATKEKIGLIVIATQGFGFLGRLFLGGVAERILRKATCPVLVVPSREEGHNAPAAHLPYRNIVVTTDFSESSRAAFPIAVHEAKRTNAKLTLAHVVESPYSPELFGEGVAMDQLNVEKLQANYLQGLEKKFDDFAAELQGNSVSRKLIAKTYSVANSVTEYSKENKVDLLIVSSRGAGNRLNLLGGVIERILHQSPCPVLVVPPSGD